MATPKKSKKTEKTFPVKISPTPYNKKFISSLNDNKISLISIDGVENEYSFTTSSLKKYITGLKTFIDFSKYDHIDAPAHRTQLNVLIEELEKRLHRSQS